MLAKFNIGLLDRALKSYQLAKLFSKLFEKYVLSINGKILAHFKIRVDVQIQSQIEVVFK